ncbi:MAG TPA: cell division FtsA domain-containing protein [Clostridia bacterium]|nr:cell division FtsA domain-containing protein [Clostridia bacterium]
MRSTISVIDFGTSKIVALVAEVGSRQRCDIIGAGTTPYDGYANARWNNGALVNEAISTAIATAEEQARSSVKTVYAGVPGQFSKVYSFEVKVDLQGAAPHVTSRDIAALFELADEQVQGIPGTPIHRSPAWFVVDDGKKTLEPLNQHGNELRALISYVVADRFFIEDITQRLLAIGKTAAGFFSTPMGEAMLFISETDRDRTALLIDMGYLNTDIMAVEGDAIIFHKNLPLGGGHIAADLAYGLEIPLESAEQVKRGFEFGQSSTKNSFDVLLSNGATQTFTREKVSEILLPRADEIAEAIISAVKESGVRLGNWSPVYLTGGGLAINKGGREYLSEKMERPVRELPRKAVKLSSAIYSSSLGLLDLIIDTRNTANAGQSGLAGFFRGLLNG